MLTLIVEAQGEMPRALSLAQFPSRIGRQADSEVRLAGWRVARLHAEIHRIERGFKLVDRGSLGGTWVNGERIVEYAPLAEDDEIAIAGYRLRVHPQRDAKAGDIPAARPNAAVHVQTADLSRPPAPAANVAQARGRRGRRPSRGNVRKMMYELRYGGPPAPAASVAWTSGR